MKFKPRFDSVLKSAVKVPRRKFITTSAEVLVGILALPRLARAAVLYNVGAFWRPRLQPRTLWMWGDFNYNWITPSMAYPNTISSSSPVQMPGSWLQVSACGDGGIVPVLPPSYFLGIRSDNTLWGWGDNTFGQLGQGNYMPVSSPVQIPGNWIQISAGGNGIGDDFPNNAFALGIQSGGSLWAWGDNTFGQLGQNSTAAVNIPSPTQIPGTWTSVSAGSSYWTGIQSNGTVWGCGLNAAGQLGQNNLTNYSSPVQIIGASNWVQVTNSYDGNSGAGTAFALNNAGQLWGCGGNTFGELTRSAATSPYFSSPVQITGSWTQVLANSAYVLAKNVNGGLYAWGYNPDGELGNSGHANKSSPVQITGSWTQIGAGFYSWWGGSPAVGGFSFGIRPNGVLYAWGLNQYYTFGNGNSSQIKSSPVQVGGSWTQVFGGMNTAFGIQPNGTLWGWGDNAWGQITPGFSGWPEGYDSGYSSPIQVPGSWLQLSGAGCSVETPTTYFALGIQGNSTLWGWGVNSCGQLGQAVLNMYRSPVQIPGSWAQVGAGGNWGNGFSLGIRTDGSLWAWGCNDSGQLGQNNTTSMSSPVQVSGGGSWTQIAMGCITSYGIKTDGTLWGWGDNGGGQIGLAANPSLTPAQVFANQGSFAQVTAGESYNALGLAMLAINTVGQLWAIGGNGNGELGVNSTAANISSPCQVPGSWSQVSTSMLNHTVAIRADGTLWAWGANGAGQCGQTNTAVNFSSPVMVSALSWIQCWGGQGFSYAVRADNTFWSWGCGLDGALGVGNTNNYSSPVQISGVWYRVTSGGGGNGGMGGQFGLGLR